MTAQIPPAADVPPRVRPQQIVQPGERRLDPALLGQAFRRAAHEQHRAERDDERHDAQAA